MREVGPFWARVPTATTNFEEWGWLWLTLSADGRVVFQRWAR